jgi:hypothetical protein
MAGSLFNSRKSITKRRRIQIRWVNRKLLLQDLPLRRFNKSFFRVSVQLLNSRVLCPDMLLLTFSGSSSGFALLLRVVVKIRMYVEHWWNDTDRRNRSSWRNTSVPLCSPHILHGLTPGWKGRLGERSATCRLSNWAFEYCVSAKLCVKI